MYITRKRVSSPRPGCSSPISTPLVPLGETYVDVDEVPTTSGAEDLQSVAATAVALEDAKARLRAEHAAELSRVHRECREAQEEAAARATRQMVQIMAQAKALVDAAKLETAELHDEFELSMQELKKSLETAVDEAKQAKKAAVAAANRENELLARLRGEHSAEHGAAVHTTAHGQLSIAVAPASPSSSSSSCPKTADGGVPATPTQVQFKGAGDELRQKLAARHLSSSATDNLSSSAGPTDDCDQAKAKSPNPGTVEAKHIDLSCANARGGGPVSLPDALATTLMRAEEAEARVKLLSQVAAEADARAEAANILRLEAEKSLADTEIRHVVESSKTDAAAAAAVASAAETRRTCKLVKQSMEKKVVSAEAAALKEKELRLATEKRLDDAVARAVATATAASRAQVDSVSAELRDLQTRYTSDLERLEGIQAELESQLVASSQAIVERELAISDMTIQIEKQAEEIEERTIREEDALGVSLEHIRELELLRERQRVEMRDFENKTSAELLLARSEIRDHARFIDAIKAEHHKELGLLEDQVIWLSDRVQELNQAQAAALKVKQAQEEAPVSLG